MCELCSLPSEDRNNAMKFRAAQLEEMAKLLRDIGSGRIKLHSDDTKTISIKAHNLIRFLVEDWM